MTHKYLTSIAITLAVMLSGCRTPDELVTIPEAVNGSVSVKGMFVGSTQQYEAKIDENAGTIKIQVPYYVSDTEPVQGDLTQMKLIATMPIGASFVPGISGIHDLEKGFLSVLTRADGTSKAYTITAEYVKSSLALVTKVSLADVPTALISWKAPNGDEKGEINIFKTTSTIESASRRATVEVSPWATVESSSVNKDGTLDLSGSPEIKVVAQDGTVAVYKVKFGYPALVPEGQVGRMSFLFNIRPSLKETFGFEKSSNRSCAVVGDYLVISALNCDFLIFNRYTGKRLPDVKINTEGCLTKTATVHAIASDDAGHLVAMTLAAANNKWVPNNVLEVYAWKDGLDKAPVKILSGDVTSDPIFGAYRSSNATVAGGTWDVGRKIGIRGDVTQGDAIITTLSPAMARIMRIILKDGTVQSITGSAWGLSMWENQTTILPLDTRPTGAFLHNSAGARKVAYVSQADGMTPIVMLPRGSWWGGMLNGMGYTEFNGMKLIGMVNSYLSGGSTGALQYCRLVVEDVTSVSPSTFNEHEILDSRLDNFDYTNGRPVGKGAQNPTLSGFTSYYNDDGSIGDNGNKTGDVAFGRSADNNAVQVYMLVTDHGVLAYEITRYDL
ncbi:MAG: DUF5018 domain-containing protein [Bacteroidales bacterium]|nr:DUF5018 domain-containing protein [Bacteroidales bacterium]MDY6000994.1 DUF5018 domain-containing protein [Candidatus Cryptobacteroides sp.]